MVTLHHLERSRSHRVLWMLEELGIEYEIKTYKRDPKTLLAPEKLKNIHPLGKSPVITDGDRTIAESSVILEYLVETHGNGRLRPPKDKEEDYWNYQYFLQAAEGSFMPYLFLSFVMSRLSKAPVPLVVRPVGKALSLGLQQKLINPNLKSQFQFLNQHLVENTWLAGDEFSAADIQMSYPLMAAESRSDLKEYPNVVDFLTRLKNRDAFNKALDIGGPVQLDL